MATQRDRLARHSIRRRAQGLQRRLTESATGLGAIGLGAIAIATLAVGSVGSASAPVAAPVKFATPVPLPAPVVSAGHRASVDPAPPAPVREAPPLTRFTAAVGADLSESLRGAGVPAAVARDYVKLMLKVEHFASEISVADRFDLVVLHFDGEPPVLVYAGMDRVGRADLQFLKYGDEHGRVQWVDARGLERRESGGISLPVGGRITSGFGIRMHPLLHRARFHRGLDLAAAWGTPIRAAADGRVVSAGWHGGYGRQVALAHGGGLDTSYAHMSRILAYAGEAVRRGQIIGFVGSSGLSTGPHIHFEARRNGQAIDPRSVRIDAPVALSEAQREAFDGQLRSVLTASGA